jgi:F0F1-type ATP synthase assembly protein I
MQERDSSRTQKPQENYNSYLKYSSLGIQLLLSIGIAAWLGYKLDLYLGNRIPGFLITFTLLAFLGNMVRLYRSINQDK